MPQWAGSHVMTCQKTQLLSLSGGANWLTNMFFHSIAFYLASSIHPLDVCNHLPDLTILYLFSWLKLLCSIRCCYITVWLRDACQYCFFLVVFVRHIALLSNAQTDGLVVAVIQVNETTFVWCLHINHVVRTYSYLHDGVNISIDLFGPNLQLWAVWMLLMLILD